MFVIVSYLLFDRRAQPGFDWWGASWGHINLPKNFSAKIDKKSLNFKNFQNVLKGFKVNFNYVAIKKFLILIIFIYKTKIDLYYLKCFEKIADIFRKYCVNMAKALSFREN